MRRTTLWILMVFGLTGCTTVEFVRRDLTPQKKATLRYSPASSEKRDAEYKEVLGKKAREFCGGDYKIQKEYEALEETGSGVRTGIGTGIGIGSGAIMIGGSNHSPSMYHFVEIDCQPGTP